jgi:hypothetical protein
LWLADYRLACPLRGTDNDNLIIRNLPLFLSDAARAWLEHLPPAQIFNWDDLVKAFAGNFQGTYVRPGNSWDLRSCRQQLGESLREYIWRFSKQRTELPNITDSDVIGAFLAGTTCRDLVSKLGRKTPTKASELMDIATKFASGQEAVEAIFRKDKQPQGRRQEDVPEASAQRGTKKKAKKKSQAKRDAADADLVAAAEHRNPRKPPGGANKFDKMRAGAAPFHGIVPRKRVLPLGQFDLPVCFGTPSNFRKETLTFEVVGFRGTYHAVLGRPCYTKFMAVPNYTYLKLKMPGPNGVITVASTYRHAYECDVECVEYAEALAESKALIADLECLSKEVPNAKHHADNFEPAKEVKSVPLDPSNDADKKVRIGSELDPK